MRHSGIYYKPAPCVSGHNQGSCNVDTTTLKAICDRVNTTALGLCLTCLRAPAEDAAPAKCTHQVLERWVENDPFVGRLGGDADERQGDRTRRGRLQEYLMGDSGVFRASDVWRCWYNRVTTGERNRCLW
jgi:hypothetical protein